MSKIVLGRDEFQDKVAGCWLGKNIGGTLGMPYEGKRYPQGLTYFEPLPDKPAANDDLDLQLVWLKMLEEQGLDPSLATFADYWNQYTARYPWNEYGFFMRNYDRGLRPPVAGCFENYFVDEMGSPIRSELWAVLHAGDPQAAARMAWKDSAIDHAGGEGTYGEMFWAAVEAAAFVEKDSMTLIRIGLHMIPLSCHIARVIREAIWCHQNKLTWGDARERIATRFGHLQPCNAIPNHGFTIIGWLYGRDFGDCLCQAVNCGYDTDCTGATLGAVLGIISGRSAIPDKWIKPVGDDIVLHKFTRDCDAPPTLTELTERTIALAERATRASSNRAFGETTQLPADLLTRLFQNQLARESLQQDIHVGIERMGNQEVAFHYGGEPVLWPGIGREVWVTIDGDDQQRVEINVPHSWKVERLGAARFHIIHDGSVEDQNQIEVRTSDGQSVVFTMLGPGAAQGFPAGDNVRACPRCGARIEACFCQPVSKPVAFQMLAAQADR
ncbi:MAG: ADP-ribosylglycohydrolase family protein [Phycisphaeraceae bacterium]|nr:ADP-ribosylglycohydrolase family protein [Phycisphaeraceae bacterium]